MRNFKVIDTGTRSRVRQITRSAACDLEALGQCIVWKARQQDTGGIFCVSEQVVACGQGTPLHAQPSPTVYYVLSGHVEFLTYSLGKEQRLRCVKGDVVIAPRSGLHGFHNPSDAEEARMLNISTPAYQAFVEALSHELREQVAPGASLIDSLPVLQKIGERHDVLFEACDIVEVGL